MPLRLLFTFLAAQALLFLAVLVLAGRRRPAPAPPVLLPAAPVPARFEAVHTGESVLLRVHLDGPVERGETMLILDDGDEIDVVRPLAGPAGRGAIGFALPGSRIGEDVRYWIEVGGDLLALGTPELRSA
jgi:hypothetical protein